MSNFLAVATVTATLKRILGEALADAGPGSVANAGVTTVRPEAATNGNDDRRGINVYLFQTTPNGAWRNADLPTRRDDGSLVVRPQAAVDLHYLLSFYGDDAALEPERLLGIAIRALNDRPVLTRGAVRDAVDSALQDDPQTFLQFSNLADQVELVKFSPMSLNLEELSKVWSVFFQTPYALSVAYQATVVLIEGEDEPRPALPVRERNLDVLPFRFPVIERIRAAAGPADPITAGSVVVVEGRQLAADLTRVRIGAGTVTPPVAGVTDTAITLTLPAATPAGVQGLQVAHPLQLGTPPVEHRGFESNVAAFVLRPTIDGAVTTAAGGGGGRDVTVPLSPDVGKGQRVVLLLNEADPPADRPARAFSFAGPPRNAPADPETSDSITIPTAGVPAGEYLVRVQVDGAESVLAPDGTGRFASPSVNFP